MGTSLFMLALWPLVIYICYKFVVLNITHIEKQKGEE